MVSSLHQKEEQQCLVLLGFPLPPAPWLGRGSSSLRRARCLSLSGLNAAGSDEEGVRATRTRSSPAGCPSHGPGPAGQPASGTPWSLGGAQRTSCHPGTGLAKRGGGQGRPRSPGSGVAARPVRARRGRGPVASPGEFRPGRVEPRRRRPGALRCRRTAGAGRDLWGPCSPGCSCGNCCRRGWRGRLCCCSVLWMQQLLMHLAVDLPQELNKSWAADMYWIHHVICTEVPQGEETMRTNANGDRQVM
ncbi:uncharacterized protein [Patagioenas fasciata]|uniref:uncharacterized protein n=1 Tax=Patagioenas fasciata TaxID=372321 RepID=UPI003A99F5BF